MHNAASINAILHLVEAINLINSWYTLFDSAIIYYCSIPINLFQCFENVYCWLIALMYARKESNHHKLRQTLGSFSYCSIECIAFTVCKKVYEEQNHSFCGNLLGLL